MADYLKSVVDNARALGDYKKLQKLSTRWATRGTDWHSDACFDVSEAFLAASDGIRLRLKGSISGAISCEMTFEEIVNSLVNKNKNRL